MACRVVVFVCENVEFVLLFGNVLRFDHFVCFARFFHFFRFVRHVAHVAHPYVGDEHAARRQHVFDVRQSCPGEVVFRDLFDQLGEEWVARSRGYESVVDAGGVGAGCQEWVSKQGIQIFTAANVHVEVNATVVVQQKVSEDVGSLNRLPVLDVGLVHLWSVVERVLFLRIVFVDPISRILVCPKHVVPVRVQRNAAIARGLVFGEPVRTIVVVEVVLVEENLMHDLRRGGGVKG